MRADNASERGVPLPDGWRNALRCKDLARLASEAGRKLETGDDMSELSCSLVGVPRACCESSSDELDAGTIVALRTPSSARVNFVLCAQIEGNDWYCHDGSFKAGEPGAPGRGCFDESDLIVKNVVEEACGDDRPAKRIEPHARTTQLRQLIDASPDAWHTLVALAKVKAECKRAELHNRKPNWEVGLACFEPDPWQWIVAEGWASQVHIYFLWTWCEGSSGGCPYELTSQHLHHLLARGDVPSPGALHVRARAMQARFEAYALDQYRRTGCLCSYLGAWVNGRHEPDPSLWDSSTAESKSMTVVYFVWEHILVGPQRKRHIVAMRAGHALYDRYPLPRWPLRLRNHGLIFNSDWLSGFAEWKMQGTSYHGISYENVEVSVFLFI